ncbi:MAG: radical SAM protein [Candidatus Cloacimonetes bacterium]|nr:radical SAM protein [Candidatus Cloacimonadota bacterium]
MQIDRLLYPITTLGPGERLVVWTIGCSKQCQNCANPELWGKNLSKNIEVKKLAGLIKQAINNKTIDGITFTGGDPLEQADEMSKLLPLLKEFTEDILVYTGYSFDDIKKTDEWEHLEQFVSVLIDGPYIDELNDNKCVLRGSTNQNIIYLNKNIKNKYLEYLQKERSIQNVFYRDRMISVGIHKKDL